MGNCLVLQERVIHFIKTNGRVLLPNAPSPNVDTKLVELPNKTAGAGQGSGVVQIKIVISKKELQAMLKKGGLTIEDIVSHELQKRQSCTKLDNRDTGAEVKCQGWAPVLECIPEVN